MGEKARPFDRVLVANRGEIAIRVLRALKEMGIESVGVFSEADRTSSHVMFADEAYCIGPGPAAESYLNIPRILETAAKARCKAIHPGYGFLAENPDFARACEETGIVFIGPTSESIRLMGLKTEARKIMKAVGVPVLPGSDRALRGVDEAAAVADDIGYPVIVKAAAGGGGKGMRIVRERRGMKQALRGARNEAKSAFGDPAVFVEKYVEQPRHIEVQILADAHGNMIHLGERDCSIQRRYQKLVEESPSPAVDPATRRKLAEAALLAAKAASYRNAGTVEFIFDGNKDFFFLEMNTRLQVEHPVTELTTGVDIVRQQIRIASGLPLELSQDRITPDGWAIECRICAEDPTHNFLPSLGRIMRLRNPEGPWVRVESYIYEGYDIPVYYDPLIAKVIVWGKTRQDAIARMARALEEYVVEGIETTIPFHIWVMRDSNFQSGDFSTSYIDEHYSPRAALGRRKVPPEAAVIAATIDHMRLIGHTGERSSGRPGSRWRDLARSESIWRLPARARRQ